MKNQKKQNISIVSEPTTEYKILKKQGFGNEFNFEKEVKRGFTIEEFRTEIHKKIDAFPWKK